MGSEANASFHTSADAAAVTAAVNSLITDKKYRVVGQSEDGLLIDFLTKKTMLNWELAVRVITTPAASGSDVNLFLDVGLGRPAALMDGMKNRKAVEKLSAELQAKLS
ncbi:MAG TPA: hypothetical protein DIW46_08430 [Microbacterium sp.]|uniref:hypothetical protein n=1 Tax=Microbacterium sp. TaxID=51671 RepID=UPI000EBB1425|nr:hypothetical protein [Microbacterium sp.]